MVAMAVTTSEAMPGWDRRHRGGRRERVEGGKYGASVSATIRWSGTRRTDSRTGPPRRKSGEPELRTGEILQHRGQECGANGHAMIVKGVVTREDLLHDLKEIRLGIPAMYDHRDVAPSRPS